VLKESAAEAPKRRMGCLASSGSAWSKRRYGEKRAVERCCRARNMLTERRARQRARDARHYVRPRPPMITATTSYISAGGLPYG